MTDIAIAALRNRVRLRDRGADGEHCTRQLETLARGPLRPRLEQAISARLRRCGVDDRALVLVRTVSVRVVASAAALETPAAVAGWSLAVGEAFEQRIRAVLAKRSRAEDEAVIFADRDTAEIAVMSGALAGRPPAWWWPRVIPGSLAAIVVLERWVVQRPSAWHFLFERALTTVPPRPLDLVLPAARVAQLCAGWFAAAAARQQVISGSAAPALQQQGSLISRHVAAVASGLDAHTVAWIRAQPHSDIARLVALAAAIRRRVPLAADAALELDALVAMVAVRTTSATSVDEGVGEVGATSTAIRPTDDRALGEARRPQADGGGTSASATHPTTEPGLPAAYPASMAVEAGGLLFLVRATARLALVRETPYGQLPDRLFALALELLRRLEPDPDRLAQRYAREREVVGVFAGLEQVPKAIDDVGVDAGDARAAIAAADELIADLPHDLRPTAQLRSIDRIHHPHPALADLVLRPGRLRLDDHRAELALPLDTVDVAVRRRGLDLDPGWVPHLGRVIRFHYLVDPADLDRHPFRS